MSDTRTRSAPTPLYPEGLWTCQCGISRVDEECPLCHERCASLVPARLPANEQRWECEGCADVFGGSPSASLHEAQTGHKTKCSTEPPSEDVLHTTAAEATTYIHALEQWCREIWEEREWWKRTASERGFSLIGLQAEVDRLRAALVEAQRALQQLGSPTRMVQVGSSELEVPTRRDFAQRASDAARAALSGGGNG